MIATEEILEIACDAKLSPLTMMQRAALNCQRLHPDWTFREIGEELGVSHQRAHVLVRGAEEKLKSIKAVAAKLAYGSKRPAFN